jgi:alpha-glucosidase (family GH31 glycosyl hydrolase)
VHAHETAYARIAKRMGIDPASELPVAFDPTDPDFLEAYFEELHHPLEDEGVDFWWLDWQQGGVTRIDGLDPLWLLNHFHFLDSGRHGKRPLTFSRYAGIGSHRYPIGFSGDTWITWESLDFQPYFTATASNAGYGWWSHDIGGHFKGYKDDELATRWVQLGVFSPVNRLHSGQNPFNTKEPWRFTADAERVMKDFLRLRHRLMPYLATMNVRAHQGEPIVSPMYYDHPEAPEAYTVPNQFMFGTELLVAPITTPADRSTGLARVKAWLPPGEWVDVFTGLRYTGGRTVYLHRTLDSIPVLARAGAVLPMVPAEETDGGTDLTARIEVRVFAGADGDFTLVEDRDDERWARTRLSYDDRTRELTVHDVEGDASTLPEGRSYEVVVEGTEPNDVPARVFAILDRAQLPFQLKADVLDVVRTSESPAHAALALQGLDLSTALLGAVSEILLA